MFIETDPRAIPSSVGAVYRINNAIKFGCNLFEQHARKKLSNLF